MGTRRIEICGGIAAGKTTLCQNLQRSLGRAEFEDFTKNPFWARFYEEPDSYAFETEMTFLLLHYSQIKTAIPVPSTVAFDYSS
jgi:deoxyadenosine/deoxycytidine kinase